MTFKSIALLEANLDSTRSVNCHLPFLGPVKVGSFLFASIQHNFLCYGVDDLIEFYFLIRRAVNLMHMVIMVFFSIG